MSVVMVSLFSLPFIPSLVADSWSFPFITGKNFPFRILVEIAVVFWVLLALVDKSYRPRFSWLLPALASLAGIMLVANLLGEHPPKSFWSSFERMDGYVTLLHWVLLTVVLGSVLKDKPINFLGFKTTTWKLFLGTALLASILVALKGIGQVIGTEAVAHDPGRINGTLGNAAYMAIYMLFMFGVAALSIVKSKSLVWRLGSGTLAIIFATLLFFTATRGTVIGFFVGITLAALIVIFFKRQAVKLRRFAIFGIVSIGLIFSGLYLAKDTSLFVFQGRNIAERLTSGISLSALDIRLTVWGMAFEGVKERPVLGWGQGNFDYVFNKYYDSSLHSTKPWFDRAHSILFDWLVAGGILGALAYFSIWLVAFYYVSYRTLVKKDETFTIAEVSVLTGLLVGYLVHILVVFDSVVSYLFFAIILAYIHSRVAQPIKFLTEFRVNKSVAKYVAVPTGLLVLPIIIYSVNASGMTAAGEAIKIPEASTPTELINLATEAIAKDTFGNQEIRALVSQNAPDLIYNPEFSVADKITLVDYVEAQMLKQIAEKPGDAKTHFALAVFYRKTEQFDKSREQFALAREISPTKVAIIIEQGITEYESDDYKAAHLFFTEAHQLVPKYDKARLYYFSTLFLTEQKVEAVAMLDELSEEEMATLLDRSITGRTLDAVGEYDILKRILKAKIATEPDDVVSRVDLAMTHYAAGDEAGATRVLKEAASDIPDFAKDGDQLIKNLEAGRSMWDNGKPEEPAIIKEVILKPAQENKNQN